MSDMLQAIAPKSDQINAEDLIGGDITIVIEAVSVRPGTEQPVSIKFRGSDKVFRPCKTVSRIIVAGWGPDTSNYEGRSLVLYRDPNVKWAGMAVGGIRVRAMSHIDQPLKLALAESKKSRAITTVQPLQVEEAPRRTGYTIDEGRRAIASSKTIDTLREVWMRDQMKPFHKELKPELDARKREIEEADPDFNDGTYHPTENPAAAEGPDDSQRGEAHEEDGR